jgi:FMN phosphatase YigB (HAD superfamily)
VGVIEHYEEALARVFEEVAPEIIEMLSDLKESGLVLGVVTNASDLDVEPWSSSVVAPYSDAFVASYQVGLAKPDPRIYYLARHRLDVGPDQVTVVGDGGSDELAGAAGVDMDAYWGTWFLDHWPEGIRPNPSRASSGNNAGPIKTRRTSASPGPSIFQAPPQESYRPKTT